jgi:hypothetical protein
VAPPKSSRKPVLARSCGSREATRTIGQSSPNAPGPGQRSSAGLHGPGARGAREARQRQSRRCPRSTTKQRTASTDHSKWVGSGGGAVSTTGRCAVANELSVCPCRS